MKIDQGLFSQEFSDHHAVLGITVEANSKDARKRYLQIARRLHPDSLRTASEDEKRKASELLSKLVNPAYEALRQEKSASEHALVLRMKGQQMSRQPDQLELASDAAKSLMAANDPEPAYMTAVRTLAKSQYESLDTILDTIGQLSELNLVYLMRKGKTGGAQSEAKPASTTQPSSSDTTASTQPRPSSPPPKRSRETIIESYLERARMFEREQDYNRAMLELREVLKTYPDSADCHGQLAMVYVKLGQNTMARVHTKRALDIQPENELAQKVHTHLQRKQGQASQNVKSTQGGKSRGGFFGLFGGKK